MVTIIIVIVNIDHYYYFSCAHSSVILNSKDTGESRVEPWHAKWILLSPGLLYADALCHAMP